MIYGLTNVACWNTQADRKMNGGQKEKHRDKDGARTASMRGVRKLMGDNLKVVLAEFSNLS